MKTNDENAGFETETNINIFPYLKQKQVKKVKITRQLFNHWNVFQFMNAKVRK